MAVRTLETSLVISAMDKTKGVFRPVAGGIRTMASASNALGNAVRFKKADASMRKYGQTMNGVITKTQQLTKEPILPGASDKFNRVAASMNLTREKVDPRAMGGKKGEGKSGAADENPGLHLGDGSDYKTDWNYMTSPY